MANTVFRIALIVLLSFIPVEAADSGRDFSGKWNLDLEASDAGNLSVRPDASLTVEQQGVTLRCSAQTGQWSYALDGSDTRYKIGNESMNSVIKWEGNALLVNTLVSGSRDYVVMDRWRLSGDRSTLTIRRQVIRGTAQTEGSFVYRRPGWQSAPAAPATPAQPPPEITVPAGTRVALMLVNTVNTKHSHEGDRIYLETAFPVTLGGRIVIPRGSSVAGTVTRAKRGGRTSGRAELFIRFDSLTLPNGVTRELRSRLSGSDSGELDRTEGSVRSEGNKAGDARKVGEAAGTGATVGVIAGGAAGHGGMGAGVGAAAGAAAGLASVLMGRGPDAVLPKGTTVEMQLDRDLRFKSGDLNF